MAQQLSTNTFTAANWIVSPDATQGTHTTITAALASASTGDTIIIRPGTYTENLTLKNGVNLSGFSPLGGSGSRTLIIGNLTDGGTGLNCTITNIALQTNSNFILTMTGNGTIVLNNCNLLCTNNTGLSIGLGSTVQVNNCLMSLSTTGIAYYTAAGTIQFYSSSLGNAGLSTTAASSSGAVQFYNSQLGASIATSSTGLIFAEASIFDCTTTNSTAITTAGTGDSTFSDCQIKAGTASAISIGTGTTVECYNCMVKSSNANAITGLGTLKIGQIDFSGTSSTINTSTVTAQPTQMGSLNLKTSLTLGAGSPLSTYTTGGSFTPALAFGGGSTGITYVAQTGFYSRIGNIVAFTIDIELSNKGSSTGAATISNLPFAAAYNAIFTLSATALTFSGQVDTRVPGGSTVISLEAWASGGGRTLLTDTAFANTTYIQITGTYLV